jgi:ribosomal protein S18 acetylase RimI-like enzyme
VANIRPRTSSDLNELVDLATLVKEADDYPVHLPNGDLRRFLAEPTPLSAWIAENDERIVGHVVVNSGSHAAVMDAVRAAGIDGGVGVVARLLVDPSARRSGIASELLHTATERIVSLGLTPVLDVVASAAPAVSLYKRAGWKQIGTASLDVPGRSIPELVFAAQSQCDAP